MALARQPTTVAAAHGYKSYTDYRLKDYFEPMSFFMAGKKRLK